MEVVEVEVEVVEEVKRLTRLPLADRARKG